MTVHYFIPFNSSLYLYPSLTLILDVLFYICLSLSASFPFAPCLIPAFCTWIILYIYLSLSTLIHFILRPSLYTISLSTENKLNTWQYFKFRGIVIMLSYIISYLIYDDQLFLNDSVFFTLHLYHLNLLFSMRYFRLYFFCVQFLFNFSVLSFDVHRRLSAFLVLSHNLTINLHVSSTPSFSLSSSLFSRSVNSWYVTLPSSLPFNINICIKQILYLTIFLAHPCHCIFLIFSLIVSLSL